MPLEAAERCRVLQARWVTRASGGTRLPMNCGSQPEWLAVCHVRSVFSHGWLGWELILGLLVS